MFRKSHLISALLMAMAAALGGCMPVREGQRDPAPTSSSPTGLPALLPGSKLLAPFQLAETQARRFSSEFTLTNRDRVLKIEAVPNLGRDGAQTMLDDGIMGVQALYANALSPYPGDISKEVVSDPRFRPQLVRTNWNGQRFHYVLLFANDRLGYGATTADAARHRSLLGWFYCERTDVFYRVRCFLPLAARPEELETLFLSLSCR